MKNSVVKALLFDMGGVVLEVDFNKVFDQLARLSELPESEIRARFTMDGPYCQHEKGLISGEEYFKHLRTQYRITATDAQMEAGWNAIFGQEITPALDAIDLHRSRFRCYGFTNTNVVHQSYWDKHFPRIRQSFDHLFVSSEIGLRKPDPEAFAHILEYVDVEPGNVLFFDDSPENIEGARQVGLQCVLVDNPCAVSDALNALP